MQAQSAQPVATNSFSPAPPEYLRVAENECSAINYEKIKKLLHEIEMN